LSLCQGFAMSRREGTPLAMLKEDMWCIEPVIGLGLADIPQYFLDGHNRFPGSAKTLEAGSNWAHAFPRLAVGKYIGIASAPLKTAIFEPDLVILYCNPPQLTVLLIAANWIDGHDVTCKMSGHAACIYAVVPTAQSGGYHVISPCMGDYRRAMARDDEIIFTAPKDKLEDLLSGLRLADEHGVGFPRIIPMVREYELSESYTKIGEMMGMDWVR
ncbi:DUF169 domain-containing protein, partial [Candidatus Omnitrophota bacterium]